jgi:predicted nucleic-acid-binding protein
VKFFVHPDGTVVLLPKQIEVLAIEHEREAFAAKIALKTSTGSFADSLIGALGKTAGCSNTVTFDNKALRSPGLAALRTILGG